MTIITQGFLSALCITQGYQGVSIEHTERVSVTFSGGFIDTAEFSGGIG